MFICRRFFPWRGGRKVFVRETEMTTKKVWFDPGSVKPTIKAQAPKQHAHLQKHGVMKLPAYCNHIHRPKPCASFNRPISATWNPYISKFYGSGTSSFCRSNLQTLLWPAPPHTTHVTPEQPWYSKETVLLHEIHLFKQKVFERFCEAKQKFSYYLCQCWMLEVVIAS